ncbi:site-2 protease family protein [Thermoproteus tenax]
MEWGARLYYLGEGAAFLLAILSVAVAYLWNYWDPIYGVLLPTIAVAIAIVPHELAHRQAARSMGCLSRFVLWPTGFLTTLILNGIVGFIAGGPILFISGYTAISCYRYGTSQEGLISLAGPATNIAISALSLILLHAVTGWSVFLQYLSRLNAFVAFFNLLPLGVLDGAKIFKWNIAVWAGMLALSVLLWI